MTSDELLDFIKCFKGRWTFTMESGKEVSEEQVIKALEQKPKTGHSFPEGATNKDIFKAIFGYEPATDSVVCNKEDWCGASEPCNYCLNNSDSIGREEDWWNAPYKPERGQA